MVKTSIFLNCGRDIPVSFCPSPLNKKSLMYSHKLMMLISYDAEIVRRMCAYRQRLQIWRRFCKRTNAWCRELSMEWRSGIRRRLHERRGALTDHLTASKTQLSYQPSRTIASKIYFLIQSDEWDGFLSLAWWQYLWRWDSHHQRETNLISEDWLRH